MSNEWVKDELETTELGDKRLNERFEGILQAFAERPNASIPAALGGRNELEAAYHFFDNDKVTPEKILKPHIDATFKRCKEQKVVLCVQDTTELDWTRPQQQVVGAGPLSGPTRRGAFLHLNEAFTVDGTPLGAVDAKTWAREDEDENQPQLTKEEKRKRRRALPIEQKESIRWIEGVRATKNLAAACPETLCVSISDGEGDIHELFVEPRESDNVHWIVRAGQERTVLNDTGIPEGQIRDSVLKTPALFAGEIAVRGRERLISCEKRSRRTTRVGRPASDDSRRWKSGPVR